MYREKRDRFGGGQRPREEESSLPKDEKGAMWGRSGSVVGKARRRGLAAQLHDKGRFHAKKDRGRKWWKRPEKGKQEGGTRLNGRENRLGVIERGETVPDIYKRY